MHFAFTDEQEELRSAVRGLIADRAPSEKVRAVMQTPEGFDRSLWRELTGMGVTGMAIPEEYGGSGYGFLELAVAIEEAGRALLPAPLLGTAVLAVAAIVAADDAGRAEALLPAIADGSVIAAVARRTAALTATRTDDGWVLTGTTGPVLDAAAADLLVVPARTGQGDVRLFTLTTDRSGLARTVVTTMDQTLRLADFHADGVAAEPLGSAAVTDEILDLVDRLAAAGLALLAVGGAERCLQVSVAYAKDRVQFGAPIGSFQAIQHKCADMLLEVESARSAAYYAAWCATGEPERLAVAASIAKSYACEAYRHAAGEQIQIHGGIGFTWEHDAHLHLKRAVSIEALYGSPAAHRASLWKVLVESAADPALELSAGHQ
jgi:alkylation response protein AidB-like acyl-CoA dehydrogenase